jgi:hypothetical protein
MSSQQAQDTHVPTDGENKANPTNPPKVVSGGKSPKKRPAKAAGRSFRVYTTAQAAEQALKTGKPVDIKSVFVLPISALVRYDNPRHEPAKLHEMGYILIGDPNQEAPEFDKHNNPVKFVSLVHLALSDNLQKLEYFVKLVEENEAVDRKDHPTAPQSIMELAEDLKLFGQLEPIRVKKMKNGWVVAEGGRRICAMLYLHAKSKVARLHKLEDAPKHEWPATVQATDLECPEDQLFVVSAKINLARKGFTELQEGRVYHEMLRRVNPATLKGGDLFDRKHPKGRNYTMKEAAGELHVHYSTFRNREALWHPYSEKTGKGLTDEDRRKVATGDMLPTFASRKSLGESTASVSQTGQRKKTKHKPLTLREMEALFDATPSTETDRREAIAECMRLTLDRATAASNKRLDAQDAAELAESDRKARSKKKGKAA